MVNPKSASIFVEENIIVYILFCYKNVYSSLLNRLFSL
jgi:hypothetical protein